VSFDGRPIRVRQAPPPNEPHHILAVEQENRRPFEPEAVTQRVERRVVHVAEFRGPCDIAAEV